MEVVLAIGVVAFAFVGILGLLPAGLTAFRKATDMSVGSQILQKIVEDARQTDFATLVDFKNTGASGASPVTFRAPLVSAPAWRYFDEAGNEVVPADPAARQAPASLSAQEKTQVVYDVSTRVVTTTALPSNGDTAAVTNCEYLATLTVQIVDNPGNAPVTFDGNYLVVPARGLSVKTFSVLLSKND